MITEGELKEIVLEIVEKIRGDLTPQAEMVFREWRVSDAIRTGDRKAVRDSIEWSLNRWYPDRSRLMMAAIAGVLGQVALDEYKNLKIKVLQGGNHDENLGAVAAPGG